MKTDKKSISKFLALVLRHKPEVIGVKLDDNGWTDTALLVKKINDRNHNNFLTLEMLEEIVEENNKQRYELNETSSKIRARQGHSINVDLELKPQVPPDTLYHGTVQKFIDAIYRLGLIKGNRQYVHLSKDIKTAITVGSRRGKPIILVVNSRKMHKDGFNFYLSTNGVWLTDHIDPKYIQGRGEITLDAT